MSAEYHCFYVQINPKTVVLNTVSSVLSTKLCSAVRVLPVRINETSGIVILTISPQTTKTIKSFFPKVGVSALNRVNSIVTKRESIYITKTPDKETLKSIISMFGDTHSFYYQDGLAILRLKDDLNHAIAACVLPYFSFDSQYLDVYFDPNQVPLVHIASIPSKCKKEKVINYISSTRPVVK